MILARIVELHWEKWDRDADDPAEHPEDGEPEGYILDRPHAPRLAEQIGPVWELVVQGHATLRMRPPATPPSLPFTLAVDAGAPDFFGASKGGGFLFASARAREWLEKAAPGSLHVTPVSATPTR